MCVFPHFSYFGVITMPQLVTVSHCFCWASSTPGPQLFTSVGSGRDADRRKKTGWRRRIVIKEDLVAEETVAKLGELQPWAPTLWLSWCWWAPVPGPTPLSCHTITSHLSPLSVSGVVRIGRGPLILSILQSQPSLTLSWSWRGPKTGWRRRIVIKEDLVAEETLAAGELLSWALLSLVVKTVLVLWPWTSFTRSGFLSRSMGVQGQFLRCRAILNKLKR